MSAPHVPPSAEELMEWGPDPNPNMVNVNEWTIRLIDEIKQLRELCGDVAKKIKPHAYTLQLREQADRLRAAAEG